VGAFMGKRRVITVRVLETLECRHLDRVGGDAVKRTISAVSDGCSRGCEELFRIVSLDGELYPWRYWRRAMRAVPVSDAMPAPNSRDGRTLPPRIALPPMPSQ
jgi:hypothetical protein